MFGLRSSCWREGEIIMSTSIYDIPMRKITGAEASLAEYKGKVVLVVNVASKCGLTPQYEGLEELYRKYRDQGFVIAGFPANDFAGQEPGTNEEIQSFCTTNFGVDFPMYDKITVVGAEKHPLYASLIEAQPKAVSTAEVPFAENLKKYGISPNSEPELLWNFEKFLVSRSGEVVKRFAPDTKPSDPALIAAIEGELAKG
jgi:glutathione peroxidase